MSPRPYQPKGQPQRADPGYLERLHVLQGARKARRAGAAAARSTLDAIAEALDGKEWNAETLEQVASILRDAGYALREPKED